MKRTTLSTAPVQPAFTAGAYYYTASPAAVGTSNTLGVGTERLVPMVLTRPLTIDRIGAEVTTVGDAGSKFRIIVRADNGSGLPNALALDAGQIAGDSATVQVLTVSATFAPGVWWFGGAVQAVTTTQPTMRTMAGTWVPPIPIWANTSTPAAGAAILGVNATGTTGAAPATITVAGTVGAAPRIFFRAA